ncbi:MAG: hypothetical protein AAF127_06915 [Pseudomonadota bacterium]
MSLKTTVSCLLGHHEPVRRKVRRDGGEYIGHCCHCGKPIRRIAHREWRARSA